MGKKKSKESNLGKAIIRDRFKGARPKNNDMTLHSVDTEDGPAWTQLKSITQQNDLEEFLHLASLADTQFTAERQTIEIVNSDQPTSAFVLSEEAETQLRHQHEKFKEFIRIPRKPKWDKRISIQEMQASEKYSFLDWRRQLAHLVASENLLLTPFEKNLEIWKQLWRVVERSDCLLQIVDARNPLFFKCDDLETYAHELCASLPVLLLVNKADLLTVEQRRQWAHYFNENNIRFLFFSALEPSGETDASNSSELNDGSFRIYHPQELHDYLVSLNLSPKRLDLNFPERITVGLVGYPNVGKSSTINALLGMKKVQVSQTPGKTKKLQTLPLSEKILLCDCPGLVFPHLASTQAEMVCNGILPIDELREFMGPAELIAKRIPKSLLEHMYSFRIHTQNETMTGTDLCKSYATARGFVRGSQGNPDETRASRVLLKDYVQGKIPYAHPPPGISPSEFNCDLHEFYLSKFPKPPPMPLQAPKQHALTGNSEAQLDAEFFNTGHAGMAHVKGKYQVASGFTRMKMGVPNSSTISTDKKHRHTKKNVKVRVPVREYYEA